ncbi:hypothetical protein V2J09_008287 [Rumex salicifolius]
MEIKGQTESILAKLMGLEGPKPIMKLQYGHQRVLSERYLQKNALICQRQKRSLDRFSKDMVDEMVEKNDSDEGILYSSSSENFSLERYEKESDRIFQKFRLPNSTLKVQSDVYLLRRIKCPDEMECVVCNRPVDSSLQNEKIPSGVKRRDRDFQRHGYMMRHGVAKQVVKELQQSVWHNYSKKFRSVSSRDEADDSPRNMNTRNPSVGQPNPELFLPIRNSNLQSMNFNVQKAEETPLISSNLNDFGETDVVEDCLSGPLSPTNFSKRSDEENITDKAIERVLDELPDMLKEIDCFRNRDCREFKATRQQVKLQQPMRKDTNEAGESITSVTWKTEETRVMSYLAGVLAELGHQPFEDLVDLSVFDKLEKKYGKDPFWLRSERRLLFDCIIWGLSNILSPSKGIRTWFKHNTKRHLLQLNKKTIKKELFDLLANQQKEFSDWLEFDEDMEIVAKEIEDDLIDMLMKEIISFQLKLYVGAEMETFLSSMNFFSFSSMADLSSSQAMMSASTRSMFSGNSPNVRYLVSSTMNH